MESGEYRALAIFGSTIYLALGFSALGSLASQVQYQYQTSWTYTAWLETALALAVGFALLAGTALLASKRRNVVMAAAVFGFLASVVGALNSLALFALGFSGGYISETIAIGAFLVLFFGFPLAMTGYFSELIRSETEAASAAGPT